MLGIPVPPEVKPKHMVEGAEVKRGHRVEFGRCSVYFSDRSLVSFLPLLMLPTRLPRVAVVALATLAVACGDITRPKATTPNLQLSYSVFALTGTPV
jgi:hypothetical protein